MPSESPPGKCIANASHKSRGGAQTLFLVNRAFVPKSKKSMPNMTGRPGHRTMEMNGGSSAPYLACTPCVPLFVHCLIRAETEDQGRRGNISIVRWNLRPVIFGVEKGAVLTKTAKMTNLHSTHKKQGLRSSEPRKGRKWRKWRVSPRHRHGLEKAGFALPWSWLNKSLGAVMSQDWLKIDNKLKFLWPKLACLGSPTLFYAKSPPAKAHAKTWGDHKKFHAAPSKKQTRFLEGPLPLRIQGKSDLLRSPLCF